MSFDRNRAEASLIQILDGPRGERVAGMGFLLLDDTIATACHCLPRAEGKVLLPDPDRPGLFSSRVRIRRWGSEETSLASVRSADPGSDLALLGPAEAAGPDAVAPGLRHVPFEELVAGREMVDVEWNPVQDGPVLLCNHEGRWIEATALSSTLSVRMTSDRIRSATSGAPVFEPGGRVVGLVANNDVRLPDATLCILARHLPAWAIRRARAANSHERHPER